MATNAKRWPSIIWPSMRKEHASAAYVAHTLFEDE